MQIPDWLTRLIPRGRNDDQNTNPPPIQEAQSTNTQTPETGDWIPVRTVQWALRDSYTGEIDGIFGPNTEQALLNQLPALKNTQSASDSFQTRPDEGTQNLLDHEIYLSQETINKIQEKFNAKTEYNPSAQITENFTWEELTKTNTGLPNEPTELAERQNLIRLALTTGQNFVEAD